MVVRIDALRGQKQIPRSAYPAAFVSGAPSCSARDDKAENCGCLGSLVSHPCAMRLRKDGHLWSCGLMLCGDKSRSLAPFTPLPLSAGPQAAPLGMTRLKIEGVWVRWFPTLAQKAR
jgi:hypothetical protein